ncbi:MAG: hypothetical protein Q4D37_10045 [Oscillospiraceae bacterium]|nr:hypothetical protein [Oscillospiraceae bacterium]
MDAMKTNTKTIDPTAFLRMYQKMQQLNPWTFERVCGIIDGIDIGFEIAVKRMNQEGEQPNE